MSHTVNLNEIEEHSESPEETEAKIQQLAQLIRESQKTVFFTGAGISTAAKIADYRGPNGVWTRMAQGRTGPQSVAFSEAIPTTTHMALKTLLEEHPPVQHIISQNVDGLHRRSGVRRENISELHGNSFIEVCWACNSDFLRRAEVRSMGKAPKTCRDCLTRVPHHCHCTDHSCPECGAMLKDSIIHFKENLPDKELTDGFAHSESADLHIVLGSSLRVAPACQMPLETAKNGSLVIVNLQATPYDDRCAVRIFAKTDFVMSRLMEILEIPIHPYVDMLEADTQLQQHMDSRSQATTGFSDVINHDIAVDDGWSPSMGFNIEPIGHCPHAGEHVCCRKLPFEVSTLLQAPCSMCGDTKENMICGHCLTVCCGRHVNGHMIQHNEMTSHPIVIGVQDLSFWCYECDAYLDPRRISEVAYFYNELHKSRFEEPAPGLAHLLEDIGDRFTAPLPLQISGLWRGILTDTTLGNDIEIKWTLCIVTQDPYPNAFGAADIGDSTVGPLILHGMLDVGQKKIRIEMKVGQVPVEFDGRLSFQNGNWTITGKWKDEPGFYGSGGTFHCHLQHTATQ